MIRIPEPRLCLAVPLLLALALGGCSAPAPLLKAPPAKLLKEPRSEPRSRQGNPPSYVALGVRYHVLESSEGYVERGLASWYGPQFHGRKTSSGEVFDMHQATAAHKTLPLPTWVQVTHLETGRSITVRVNDRGPFKEGRIIDLSFQAAKELGISAEGVAPVEVRTIRGPGPAAPQHPEHMYVQLGAFAKPDNAQTFLQDLRTRGLAQLSVRTRKRSGRVLHRVVHGPFQTQASLEQAIATLETAGITEYTTIRIPAKQP